MVFGMMFACWIICQLNGWGHLIALDLIRVLKTALGAWLGFFAIGLVLWGIYTGKFSPTEAAGVTVGFCVIVGVISLPLFRMMGSLDPDRSPREKKTREMLVVEGVKLTEVPAITMRSAQITGILAPLIAVSVVMQQILSLVGAAIGFITPPYGLNLYVASGVTGVPYFRLLRYAVPYLITLITVWIVVAMLPELSSILLPNRGG